MSALLRRYVAKRPIPFTITKRRLLATAMRGELAAYLRLVSDDRLDAIAARARCLDSINRKFDALLALEGLDR